MQLGRGLRGLVLLFVPVLNTDVHGLGKESQRPVAPFSANTTLLHPTEWRPQVTVEPTVDPANPNIYPWPNFAGLFRVLRPDRAAQPVLGCICHLDHLILTFKPVQGDDRPAASLLCVIGIFARQHKVAEGKGEGGHPISAFSS